MAQIDELAASPHRPTSLDILQVHGHDTGTEVVEGAENVPTLRTAPAGIERDAHDVFVAGTESREEFFCTPLGMVLNRAPNAELTKNLGRCGTVSREKLTPAGDHPDPERCAQAARRAKVRRATFDPRRIASD